MKIKYLLLTVFAFTALHISAQTKKKKITATASITATATSASTGVRRPKLVVGIVVDQMRWDYLYRFYDRYGEGGFKRLLKKGLSCDNTSINYLPAFTAVGHTCVFTGSVPAFSGIAGNDWVEQSTNQRMY